MTEQDARNPEAVGFLTAAYHYAAAHRAAREGKPEPVPADVEKFIRYVMHVDPRVNALWYRLLDEIFTYEKRQAEIQEKIAKEVRGWKERVGIEPVPIIPREDWKGTTVEQAQERMLNGMGIPPHLANPARGTPQFGPSPLLGFMAEFAMMRRFKRHKPPTQHMTDHDANTLVISDNGMAYLKSGEPPAEDDPQPITVFDKPQ